ncbi:MAG: F0F1 ATP synthase subunit epsilon [Candidatus Margulisbacteria bacterium]|nr:F0F1 ATP synthase subunit epsilon [Candidatus Margulisiibacteriota bacterium]MBU1617186.1 F0F1 ATP synthase subunit epsilon [Candidatus Margulisiibacteriota bacterium]MBU1867434.1 F0F1 ATP synthase subunit epsilon [Candidatus Margulisiibacteriota bacterium]
MSNFDCRITTPEKVVYEGEITYLNASTLMGPTGVLAHHAPLISALKAGKIEVHLPNKTCLHFKMTSGMLKVENNKAEVFSPDIKAA